MTYFRIPLLEESALVQNLVCDLSDLTVGHYKGFPWQALWGESCLPTPAWMHGLEGVAVKDQGPVMHDLCLCCWPWSLLRGLPYGGALTKALLPRHFCGDLLLREEAWRTLLCTPTRSSVLFWSLPTTPPPAPGNEEVTTSTSYIDGSDPHLGCCMRENALFSCFASCLYY